METLTALISAAPVWLVAITGLVTAANAFTMFTKTTSDDKIFAAILKVLNIVALNFGKNTNKDDTTDA